MMKAQFEARLSEEAQHYIVLACERAGFHCNGLLPAIPNRKQAEGLRSFEMLSAADGEKIARSIVETLVELVAARREKLIHKATYPARSTSAVSNLAEQQELSALAESLSSMAGLSTLIDVASNVFEAQ